MLQWNDPIKTNMDAQAQLKAEATGSFHSHFFLLLVAEMGCQEESGNVIFKTLLLSLQAGIMLEPASSQRSVAICSPNQDSLSSLTSIPVSRAGYF